MLDELNTAIDAYQAKWQAFEAERRDPMMLEQAKPTSVGWKTEDLADFDRRFALVREYCQQVHLVWLNDRWIATMLLRQDKLHWGIGIVKLMQRRPNSTDAIGLDHIDFYAPAVTNAQTLLAQEADLKATDEANGLCKWTSLWFADTEAKLRRETTLAVCVAELHEADERVLADIA